MPPVRKQYALQGRDPVDGEIAAEIDRVGGLFRRGLRRGFSSESDGSLAQWVRSLPQSDRAVTWEGAAMAVAWIQRTTVSERRWQTLFDEPGEAHHVALALGLGWALSWLGDPTDAAIAPLHPLLRWRVVDGYGFRDGMVTPRRYVLGTRPPPQIDGSGRAAWRQGLGRSLWYTTRGDLRELAAVVNAFPSRDRPELWTGVGVAATWIGCLDQRPMRALRDAAGHDAHWLALGAALASRTSRDAGGWTDRIESPCLVLAGAAPGALASITDAAEAALPAASSRPLFQHWKDDIAARLT